VMVWACVIAGNGAGLAVAVAGAGFKAPSAAFVIRCPDLPVFPGKAGEVLLRQSSFPTSQRSRVQARHRPALALHRHATRGLPLMLSMAEGRPVREAAWRIAVFQTMVAVSTAVLEFTDILMRTALFVLRVLRSLLSVVGLGASTRGSIPGPRRHVVVVGASFGGLACARMLRRDFDVTIIDEHDYFEYTPGILRNFVKPEHMHALSASLHGVKGVKFVHGSVDYIGASAVRVRLAPGSGATEGELAFGRKIKFDYGIVASGSSYPAGIKAGRRTATLEQRAVFWRQQAHKIAAAKTVVVVGGGPVGVELAAEIIVEHPATKIVLVHGGKRLLPDFTQEVAARCEGWLLLTRTSDTETPHTHTHLIHTHTSGGGALRGVVETPRC
jgi:hypothetical protein